jgi:hypothetical protein
VNAIDKNFNTSLHLAARGGYIKCQHQCCEWSEPNPLYVANRTTSTGHEALWS